MRFRPSLILSAVCATVLMGVLSASSAHAQNTYTFNAPTGNSSSTDLMSMDHHSLYTWKTSIAGTAGDALSGLRTNTVTGATLTFTNIRNWNSQANQLHIWLFDTSLNLTSAQNAGGTGTQNGVTQFYDDKTSNTNVTDLTDDFSDTRYHNGKDANNNNSTWLLANGTAGTDLGDLTNLGTTGTTQTVTFSAAQLITLNTYMHTGNDFSFGFDPDCHYYSDSIKFTVNYNNSVYTGPGSNITATPEPGMITFAATSGLPLIGLIVRGRRRARLQKAA